MKAREKVAQWYRAMVGQRQADRVKTFPDVREHGSTDRYVSEFCRLNGLKHDQKSR